MELFLKTSSQREQSDQSNCVFFSISLWIFANQIVLNMLGDLIAKLAYHTSSIFISAREFLNSLGLSVLRRIGRNCVTSSTSTLSSPSSTPPGSVMRSLWRLLCQKTLLTILCISPTSTKWRMMRSDTLGTCWPSIVRDFPQRPHTRKLSPMVDEGLVHRKIRRGQVIINLL